MFPCTNGRKKMRWSPGKKLLDDAKINNKALYDDIIQKADDFEKKFNQQKEKDKHKHKVKGKQCH